MTGALYFPLLISLPCSLGLIKVTSSSSYQKKKVGSRVVEWPLSKLNDVYPKSS